MKKVYLYNSNNKNIKCRINYGYYILNTIYGVTILGGLYIMIWIFAILDMMYN